MLKKLIDWIRMRLCFSSQLKIDVLNLNIIELKEDYEILKKDRDRLAEEIVRIKKKLANEKQEEDYWNSRWPKASIQYQARNRQKYDVRNFIVPNDTVFKALRKELGIENHDSHDDIVYKCLVWVTGNCKYKLDDGEYWMFPQDFLYKRRGDCEDGTHLVVSLARNFGVPAQRIKVACGWVMDPKTKKYTIGHSYTIYRRMTDEQWVDMDWSYYPSKFKVKDRIPHRERKTYGTIWWTFNDRFCWRQTSTKFSGRVKDV